MDGEKKGGTGEIIKEKQRLARGRCRGGIKEGIISGRVKRKT